MKDKTTRIALIGSNGMLAGMIRRMAPSNYEIVPLDLPEFDITDGEQVFETLGALAPSVIINCAAFTNVDGCEMAEELATRVNGTGPGYLADAAKICGATLVHISTDYVFDGTNSEPYAEEDAPGPCSAYGRSKLLGEQAIVRSGLENYLIIRTSWLYGPGGKNFVETILRLARERDELRVVADQLGTPTFTADLAQAVFTLIEQVPEPGLYHFSNAGQCSWHEFACAIVEAARMRGEGLAVRQVLPIRTEEYPLPAPRPAYSVFSKAKYEKNTGCPVPYWREALERYFVIREA